MRSGRLRQTITESSENLHRLLCSRALENDHEFLAAVTGDDVVGAEMVSKLMGEADQCAVAGFVAVGVVDQLEVVEIGHGQCERCALALQPSHDRFEVAPIREACQNIRRRLQARLIERSHRSNPNTNGRGDGH